MFSKCVFKFAHFDYEDVLGVNIGKSISVMSCFYFVRLLEIRLRCSLGFMFMAKQNNLGFKFCFGEGAASIIKNYSLEVTNYRSQYSH